MRPARLLLVCALPALCAATFAACQSNGTSDDCAGGDVDGDGGDTTLGCPESRNHVTQRTSAPALVPRDIPSVRVLPHFAESMGHIPTQTDTTDQLLELSYIGGLVGVPGATGMTVELYLFANDGSVLQGTTGAVCDPCAFEVSITNRVVQVSFDDLILTNGGGFTAPMMTGFASIIVAGNDPSAGVVTSVQRTSRTGLPSFDVDSERWTESTTSIFTTAVEEDAGHATTEVGIDTVFYAVYMGGRTGVPGSAGADLDVYVFDDDGGPMHASGGGAVCDPCSAHLSFAAPKVTMRLQDLIEAAGGFDEPTKRGRALLLAHGADPNSVALERQTLRQD